MGAETATCHRPRFAIVNDSGRVALFEQWINVVGPYAVMLIDECGKTVATHSFNDIADAIEVPGSALVSLAKYGPWMTSIPRLDSAGNHAEVDVGGKVMAVRMDDGQLTSTGINK